MVDFESEEKLGIHSLAGFTWKDLLDFDACTECGRCTAACPAHRVGKELSPRDIILDLQRLARVENADFSQPYLARRRAFDRGHVGMHDLRCVRRGMPRVD